MLIKKLRAFFKGYKEPRYRGGISFYASELLKDRRDLYWSKTGEPATNPMDLRGNMTVGIGIAVEDWLTNHIFSNAHAFGLHRRKTYGDQIRAGEYYRGINITSRFDDLLDFREGEKFVGTYVTEIKFISGFGAKQISQGVFDKMGHLAQLGSCTRTAHSYGVTDKALLVYVLNPGWGDDQWNVITFECAYDAETGIFKAHTRSDLYRQSETSVNYSVNLTELYDNLVDLKENYIDKEVLPPADKLYKYAVTPESVSKWSDADIKKAHTGRGVVGDWEVIYSSYKEKHLELQGGPGYSDDERAIISDEFFARGLNKAKRRKTG